MGCKLGMLVLQLHVDHPPNHVFGHLIVAQMVGALIDLRLTLNLLLLLLLLLPFTHLYNKYDNIVLSIYLIGSTLTAGSQKGGFMAWLFSGWEGLIEVDSGSICHNFNTRLLIMMEMGMQECNSFDEDDIDELEAELVNLEGPSLCHFQLQEEMPIVHFSCKTIIKSILDEEGRDLKLIGNDRYSEYHAFFYTLLLLGVEERRNYPHLNTLIR